MIGTLLHHPHIVHAEAQIVVNFFSFKDLHIKHECDALYDLCIYNFGHLE